MSTLIQINITNNSNAFQTFFVFQQPAAYAGGSQVYSNSVWSKGILPSIQGGSSATFLANLQYYAGVQEAANQIPQVGQVSGYSSALRAIGLTPAAGGTPTNNTTNMIILPALGLTAPANTVGPQQGAFRVVTPGYNPTVTPFNVGSATQSPQGTVTLSNFIVANPNQNIDCQPILTFYVQTGTYTAGTVINFTSSSLNAAVCDATTGFLTFNVTYNIDGTWSVTPFAQTKIMGQARSTTPLFKSDINENKQPFLPQQDNVNILNEAGTGLISTGYAANFNFPITVQNLSAPQAIEMHRDYILEFNGARTGRLCIDKLNNTAEFA